MYKRQAFLAKVNPTPMDYTIHAADPSVAERVDAHLDEMSAALKDADKAARMQKVEELKSSIIENDFTEEMCIRDSRKPPIHQSDSTRRVNAIVKQQCESEEETGGALTERVPQTVSKARGSRD